MSKEKQIDSGDCKKCNSHIEEMAKDLCQAKFCSLEEWNECKQTGAEYCYKGMNVAKDLYRYGYRKQSENTVELPCKIGDTVYIIDEADDESGEDYVLAVKVLQFFINEHGIAIELKLPLGMRLNTWMVVGENVFLTETEAEKALAKMKGGAE